MTMKRLGFVLLGLCLAGSVAAVVLLRLDHQRLQERVAGLRQQGDQATRLREENQRTQVLLARIRADADGGARAIHENLLQARARVEELEQRALAAHRQMQAQAQADDASLATNQDPEKGLTRLENCRDVGTGTPAAAFQTFVWAALKGEDQRLAGMIAFDGEARAKAEASVAALPEAARAQYATPEKLAALFFASALTAQPSAQIVEVASPDSRHAVVSVRGLTDKIQRVPMQLGAQGWQITVPAGMAEKLGQWAQGGSRPPGR